MKILCNHPLDSFGPRAGLRGVELLTFGPAARGRVHQDPFPFDLEFDPARGCVAELLGLLPPGWRPDLLLLYYPGQEPLPVGLERSPVPVVGVVSDWNLHFEQLWGLAPFFDAVAADRLGTRLLRRAGYVDAFYWPQYTFREQWHRPRPDPERDIDVGFVGNLNPEVQGERLPWLARVAALGGRLRVRLEGGLFNADYGRFLARTRIGFNRSIRGEMNLRAFEVCAAGALLLMERENGEVREYLVPDEEVVLYGDDDLERLILWFAGHEEERARIAAAGRRKILDYSLARNLDRLRGALAGVRAGERPAAPAWRLHLARGVAMSRTWAPPEAILAELVEAARLRPGEPETRNALGVVLAAFWPQASAGRALRELLAALEAGPTYVPPALNLAFILEAAGRRDEAVRAWREARRRAEAAREFGELRGLLLPLTFSAWENALRRRAAEAVLAGEPGRLAEALALHAEEKIREGALSSR